MALNNTSQVMLRNLDLLHSGKVLIVNFPDDELLVELQTHRPDLVIHAVTSNFANFQRHPLRAPHYATCAASIECDERVSQVIVFYPKAKAEFQMLLANIQACISDNANILVVGETRGGVKSVEKLLPAATRSQKRDSARHCALYLVTELPPMAEFNLHDYAEYYPITVAGISVEVCSLPGVFSHGELDIGTAQLLNDLPRLKGEVLDFGCGSGVISAFLAKRQPELAVTALDVSALATAATELTFQRNGLTAKTLLSDGLASVSETFSHIVTNPPFHTGIATDYDVTEQFIKRSRAILHAQGQLWLVANSFLKYPPILAQTYRHVTTLSKTSKFAVYNGY